MATLSRVPLVGRLVRRLHASIDARIAAQLDSRFGAIEDRLHWLDRERIELIDQEVQRISPQVGALEVRLADREFAERVIAADRRDAGEREMMEWEHRRISTRLQAISHYEERVRRLEVAVFGPEDAPPSSA